MPHGDVCERKTLLAGQENSAHKRHMRHTTWDPVLRAVRSAAKLTIFDTGPRQRELRVWDRNRRWGGPDPGNRILRISGF